ncbi:MULTISPECIES: ATP synthase F1 subunit delta [unclassified Roseburia]|uniref:ATP synthase F1 subunit delta n=1 Tax=unclassified Roseburia TaxID=2637578 RepID=UPI001313EBFD|nr:MULTISPECIES: ATP synthase F1 subunit delta [unclassified Roseburia]
MTQEAVNNAKVLYRLGATRQEADELRELYELTPELLKVLTSPVISIHKKDAVIEKIYQDAGLSKVLVNYTRMMCRLGFIGEMEDILDAFYLYWDRQNHILRAELTCAGTPQPEEEAEARKILAEKYPDCEIVLTEKEDENLLGGYIIKVHHKEYDRSYEGRLRQLERKLTGR